MLAGALRSRAKIHYAPAASGNRKSHSDKHCTGRPLSMYAIVARRISSPIVSGGNLRHTGIREPESPDSSFRESLHQQPPQRRGIAGLQIAIGYRDGLQVATALGDGAECLHPPKRKRPGKYRILLAAVTMPCHHFVSVRAGISATTVAPASAASRALESHRPVFFHREGEASKFRSTSVQDRSLPD